MTVIPHLLLSEDNPDILDVMTEILQSEGFRITATANGEQAFAAFEQDIPDLIIADLMMPVLDGFGLLRAVRVHPQGGAVPFLFLSARTDHAAISQARALGADDFFYKPFDPDELITAVRSKLERRHRAQLFDTRQAHLQTVTMLANSIEARERYTRGHVERVQTYALKLARALNWDNDQIINCEFGALLHDVGKIFVSRRILNKRRRLTYTEWAVMRHHPTVGAKMLDGVDHLKGALPYVLYHHERWDGTGYPYGLAYESIPAEGRLLSIVDAYDAMTSDRPYRMGRSINQALEQLEQGAGTQFDPAMVAAFVTVMHV